MKKLLILSGCCLILAGCFSSAHEPKEYNTYREDAQWRSTSHETLRPQPTREVERPTEAHPAVTKPIHKTQVKCQYKNAMLHKWTRSGWDAQTACDRARAACHSWEKQHNRNPHQCMKVSSWTIGQ